MSTAWQRQPQRLRAPKKDINPKRTKRPASWFIEEKKAADERYRTGYDAIFGKKEPDMDQVTEEPTVQENTEKVVEIVAPPVAINEATGRALGRFDYVRYDETAQAQQTQFKQACIDLEKLTNGLTSPRAKALAIQALETFYMWVGKAIRDDQVARTGAAPLQEERKAG